MIGTGGASSLAAATPWGAAASAAAQIASQPVSLTTSLNTGARTIGGLNFGATPQTQQTFLIAAAVIAAVWLLAPARRK